MRVPAGRALLGALILTVAIVPVATAATPPSVLPTSSDEFEAGLTCDFAVLSEGWDRSRTVTRGPLTVVVGPAVTRLTNLDDADEPSVSVRTNGIVTILERPDGSQRITATGSTLFYFFPGDVTPDGSDDGGWFIVHGHVVETLAADDFVTSFKLKGWYRDLCAEIDG